MVQLDSPKTICTENFRMLGIIQRETAKERKIYFRRNSVVVKMDCQCFYSRKELLKYQVNFRLGTLGSLRLRSKVLTVEE